jgi:hypothetical protein
MTSTITPGAIPNLDNSCNASSEIGLIAVIIPVSFGCNSYNDLFVDEFFELETDRIEQVFFIRFLKNENRVLPVEWLD